MLNHTLSRQERRMRKVQVLIKVARMPRRILIPASDKAAGGVKTAISKAGLLPNESVAALYSPASRHVADDDRRAAGRHRGLPATAGFSLAGSRLSHHSGYDVLPRRRPDGDGFIRD